MTGSTVADSIPALLRDRARALGDAPAILTPGRSPLSWRRLAAQAEYVARVFGEANIAPDDRVASVLPDGAEAAVAFLTVASCATFAPLNPSYRREDFEFYLNDLRASVLILPEGSDSPARSAAIKLGIRVAELAVSTDASAGEFALRWADGFAPPSAARVRAATADDVALVLHTSGTTSRPKIVPLTHANLCSSAQHVAGSLQLTRADRGLSVMPLFHIHGLVGALLSSIAAGATVVCAGRFSAEQFFAHLEEFQPSWFTAVPTMHQAILARAGEEPMRGRHKLRLIRSSSAALPEPVFRGLEETFGVPVIESYGMTEASHQMTSNPLPPGERKPGSVGKPAGPEVAVMDNSGQLVAPGERGEIVIRGPNVTRGYENNPEANAAAFSSGWFRTGDQGYFDEDGYLFITGRLKEMINRGGEKVAPREIDEALLSHPAVAEAVAFAIAHPTLGEDVAAAVVLRTGASCSEADLRAFALERLSAVKAPTRIIIVREIPRGPTGKVQRIGLAERLAGALAVAYESPASGTEALVANTIEQVLRRTHVGRQDNFFSLGGDSLRAVQVMARLRQPLGIDIPVFLLFQYPTPALLAAELDRRVEEIDLGALAAELEKLSPEEIERLLADSSS